MAINVLFFVSASWEGLPGGQLYDFASFISYKGSWALLFTLLGVAVAGGMFVVPLYAFLTTTVDISQTASTIAANNIVNSGGMVVGSLAALGLSIAGVTTIQQLLLISVMCLVAAWLGYQLHMACDDPVTCPLADRPAQRTAWQSAGESDSACITTVICCCCLSCCSCGDI